VVYGIGIGEGTGYLKDMVRLDGMDQETRELWSEGKYADAVNRFFGMTGRQRLTSKAMDMIRNPSSAVTTHDLLSAATQSIYDAGGLGFPGEWLPGTNRRIRDLTGNPAPDPWTASMPVTAAELLDFAKRIGAVETKSDTYAERLDLPGDTPYLDGIAGEYRTMQAWSAAFDQLNSSFVLVRRLNTLLGLGPPLSKLDQLKRKEKREGELSVPEYVEMGKLQREVMGRYEGLAQAVEDAKANGPTKKRRVFDAMGQTSSGTPKRE
jgi:hypothetical protein